MKTGNVLSDVKRTFAVLLLIGGVMLVTAGGANVFNIDRQPVWLLLTVIACGIALCVAGGQLWHRNARGGR